jgi:hypothetical protein
MAVVHVAANEGEVLAGPKGIRILEDGSNTGHRIGFLEARLPPGIDGPPQHIHREHSETFYSCPPCRPGPVVPTPKRFWR